eukprot:10231308-Heterocapsa_arctica.AAC.1
MNSEPDQFGQLIAADHVVLRAPDQELTGEKAGLIVADFGTDYLFAPMKVKTHDVCTQVLRDFIGPDTCQ